MTVQLRNSENKVVKTAAAGDNGVFDFGVVTPGTYNAGISPQTFAKPWGGFAWLGTKLITPSLIIAYIWIWAGFAMVVIAAGLSAMPRDVLEAARTDGATRVAGVPARHRAAARAGALGRLHHDDHQRPQGLRPRDHARAGLVAERGERDRARDVADVVRRHQRLRRRLGDRGLPLRARGAGARCSTSSASGERHSDGRRAAESSIPQPKLSERDTVAGEDRPLPTKAPVNLFLILLGLLWLIPTLGLFLTSILPAQAFTVKGWWQIFSKPSLATWSELQRRCCTTTRSRTRC